MMIYSTRQFFDSIELNTYLIRSLLSHVITINSKLLNAMDSFYSKKIHNRQVGA